MHTTNRTDNTRTAAPPPRTPKYDCIPLKTQCHINTVPRGGIGSGPCRPSYYYYGIYYNNETKARSCQTTFLMMSGTKNIGKNTDSRDASICEMHLRKLKLMMSGMDPGSMFFILYHIVFEIYISCVNKFCFYDLMMVSLVSPGQVVLAGTVLRIITSVVRSVCCEFQLCFGRS